MMYMIIVYTMTKYYKFINVDEDGTMKNRDYIFKMGMNEIKNFDDTPECTPDALYFSDLENIHLYVEYGNVLFEVSCPVDAKIIQVEDDKYKTDKLVVEKQVIDDVLLQDIYNKAIECCCSLQFVPDKYKTRENCQQAMQIDLSDMRFIPDSYKTNNFYTQAVQLRGHALRYVPDEYKTYDLCLLAVFNCGSALYFVPEEHKTFELCVFACQQNRFAIDYAPEHIQLKLNTKPTDLGRKN